MLECNENDQVPLCESDVRGVGDFLGLELSVHHAVNITYNQTQRQQCRSRTSRVHQTYMVLHTDQQESLATVSKLLLHVCLADRPDEGNSINLLYLDSPTVGLHNARDAQNGRDARH